MANTQSLIPPNIDYGKISADKYSPDETYKAGDLRIQNNALWKAKQDINVAEAWTPDHWDPTTLAAEFSLLNSRMVQESYFQGQTDSNGNIYPEIPTEKYWVLSAYASNTCVSQVINTEGSAYIFHCSSFSDQNLGAGTTVTVYYTYIAR